MARAGMRGLVVVVVRPSPAHGCAGRAEFLLLSAAAVVVVVVQGRAAARRTEQGRGALACVPLSANARRHGGRAERECAEFRRAPGNAERECAEGRSQG